MRCKNCVREVKDGKQEFCSKRCEENYAKVHLYLKLNGDACPWPVRDIRMTVKDDSKLADIYATMEDDTLVIHIKKRKGTIVVVED